MAGNMRQRPPGFEADARTMTQKELRAKYQAGMHTVRRWLDEMGAAHPKGHFKRPVAQYEAVTERPPTGRRTVRAGQLVAVFPSLMAAAKSIWGDPAGIGQCCKGKLATAYGYVWKYQDQEEQEHG